MVDRCCLALRRYFSSRASAEGTPQQRSLAQIELLLPLVGATEIDDWPGGVRQQYRAVRPLIERLASTLYGESVSGAAQQRGANPGAYLYDTALVGWEVEVIDDADAVTVWRRRRSFVGGRNGELRNSERSPVIVVFPNAETLRRLKQIVELEGPSSEILLVNAQWQRDGQIVSDFGIGIWKQRNEEFVDLFEQVFSLKQTRVDGTELRILREPNGPSSMTPSWQVFALDAGSGGSSLLGELEREPVYADLEAFVAAQPGTGSLLEKLQREFDFNYQSLKEKPPSPPPT